MKYQNRFGMANLEDSQDDLHEVLKYIYSKQDTIEDIQSFTLYMYSLIGGLSAEYLIRKGLEIRKAERDECKNNGG
jgi:hypothetical protein